MEAEAPKYEGAFWDMKGAIEYSDKWLLMASPAPIILIWLAYIGFVLKYGVEFMKKREAFKLNNVLIAYNAIQVIISCYIAYIGSALIWNYGLVQKSCIMDDKVAQFGIVHGTHLYFLAKVSELLDTIFFVLRKKQNQVTFLHVYHHSLMMFATWITLKFEPSYTPIFVGTINSYVHIVMYAYYGLSAFPGISQYLWWKKYITTMQLVQFVMAIIQAFLNYKISECKPSYFMLFLIVGNCFLFVYLFGDFYLKSYTSNKAVKVASTNSAKAIQDDNNDNIEYNLSRKNANRSSFTDSLDANSHENYNRKELGKSL